MTMIVSNERIVREYPVDILQVVDGGTVEKRRIKVDFKLLGRKARKEIGAELDLLKRVVVSAKPFHDEAGNEIPFTPELFEQLLDDDAFAIALAQAYYDALTGGGRRKN